MSKPTHQYLRVMRLLPVVAVALIVTACGLGDLSRTTSSTPITSTASAPTQPAAQLADPRGMGDPNAPIKMIEYSDFQCPYCVSFTMEVKPQIDEQYIKTGKVYFVHRDFPLVQIHPGALQAAQAANCAAELGNYWPMNERIFKGSQASEWGGGGEADLKTFVRYAQELQLNPDEFQRCIESSLQAKQIETDIIEATKAKVESTPSFVVNGELHVGALAFEQWKQIFDQILAK